MNGAYSFTPSQKKAINTLDRSVYLPAGAGSGKTAVLVARFLAIVTHDDPSLRARVDEILALTFTEKAAIEMKRRIRHELQGRDLESDLRALEASYIGTIHGFCARLLRENAFAANVLPDFEVLDEVSGPMLLERVLEECFEEGPDDLQRAVLRYGEGPVAEALRQLLRLFKTRGSSGERVESLARDMDSLYQRMRDKMGREVVRFQEIAANYLPLLEPVALGDAADRPLARLVFAASGLTPGNLDLPRVSDIGSALNSVKGLARYEAEVKGAVSVLKEEYKRIAPYVALDEAREQEGVLQARILLLAALDLMRRYDAAKAERGVLDFDDLQQQARDLLLSNPPLLDRHRRHFRYIMVDEFQDTNLLQAEIVDLLRGPRNLFVVGDAKQSIYGFRDADVAIFREFERKLCSGETGERIPLRENFRSRPELIRFVNSFFAELWREDDFPFEPLDPAYRCGAKLEPSVEVILVKQDREESLDRCRLVEAELVAERLRALVEGGATASTREGNPRPLGYGDVALLFRASTSMHLYERVFRDHGVPHYVSSSRGFYRSQEVADLINLLSVVDNPINDVPLAGVLRSPFVGVNEDTLYLVRHPGESWADGVRTSLYEAVVMGQSNQDLEDGERAKLSSLLHLLGEFRAKRRDVTLGQLAAEAVERTAYERKLLTLPDARRRLANVRRFLQLADTFHSREAFDLRGFLQYLGQVQEWEPREAEAPMEPAEGAAVRFLTIHEAKGLEFPIVVIADMGRKFGVGPKGDLVVSKDYLITPKHVDPLTGDGEDTASSHLAKRKVREADLSEEKRLLYVAMTRAAEHLMLVGTSRSEDLKPIRHAAAPMDWVRTILHLASDEEEEGSRSEGAACYLSPYGGADVLARICEAQDIHLRDSRVLRLADRVRPRLAAGDEIPEGEEGIAHTERSLDEASSILMRVEALPPAPPRLRRHSVTELMAFGECPRAYLLRFILRLPSRGGVVEAEAARSSEDGMEFGAAFHSVMELLDLAGDPWSQLTELERAGAVPERIRERLQAGVAGLWSSPLFPILRSASLSFKEQRFSLLLDDAVLTGTVDLLVRTPQGEWWIVDYKTDAIGETMVEEKARRYRFQVEAYAYACGRILGSPVSRVLIYFAHPQVWWEELIGTTILREVESRLAGLVRGIESGDFVPRRTSECARCIYDGRFCS